MSKKSLSLLVFVFAVAMLAAGDGLARQQPGQSELTEEFHQSYPLAPGGRVSLSNINGKVSIAAWDRNEVKVDALKKAYKPERLREAEIKIDARGDHLHIETEYPKHEYRTKENWTREDSVATVEYTLTVPRGARLAEVELVNGALHIEGLSGAVNASSVNGRVTARGLTGPVKLSVVNGLLEASFDRLNGSSGISLSSVNGPLNVTIPSDANVVLRADTVHGSIKNDFNLPVREGEYVGREIEGRLGAGAARLNLSNVNGAINVRRAADNRPLSPATNLLSETTRHASEDFDDEADEARKDAREAAREVREAERETAREIREARAEAARERAAESREAREVAREAARIARDVEREVNQELSNSSGVVREDAQRRIERESHTVPVQGASRIRIETFDGPVNIRAWDKPEVMYTAIKRAWDEREMKGIKVQATTGAASEVVLRAEFDKSFAHDYQERGGRVVSFNSAASVEFDVYVPRNSTLFVSTGDGRLRVEGVNGALELRTGDGPIDVAGSRGRLDAQTGDGRIRVDNFDGEAAARTGDGRITLDGRFTKLAARTGDGTISLSVPADSNITLEIEAESVSNDGVAVAEDGADKRVRRWRIGGGGELYTLRTGGGQVILRRR
ncbi:MAG TPA: DUF4097 family beta strand repeat-containing protein [Pyrinomonadaceae bacterium]|nr:DUF4097 family beta strand repeat-containing protein [Pyrinomonadaceae bacterium]